MLACTVFSKLTLVFLTATLRHVTQQDNFSRHLDYNEPITPLESKHDIAVSLYWQLLLVMTIPTLIALVRTLFLGVLGKSTANFPWPKFHSIVAVSLDVFVYMCTCCVCVVYTCT